MKDTWEKIPKAITYSYIRKDGREVEGTWFEIKQGATLRGFKSPSFRFLSSPIIYFGDFHFPNISLLLTILSGTGVYSFGTENARCTVLSRSWVICCIHIQVGLLATHATGNAFGFTTLNLKQRKNRTWALRILLQDRCTYRKPCCL